MLVHLVVTVYTISFFAGLSIHDDPYLGGGNGEDSWHKSNHVRYFLHLLSWGAILGVPIASSAGVETTSNISPYKLFFPPFGEYIK